MNIELRPDNVNAFSRVNNIAVNLLATLTMIAVFLGLMYALFPVLRTTVFGFKHTEVV